MRFFSKAAALSVVGMALIAAALLYAEGAFERRPWGADHFPNVVLTTQHGKKVRLYDDLIKGKAVAFNTFFSGCGDVCPLGTAKMLELQKLLGDRVGRDIFFYSISIDPIHDTPESLKAYADRFNIGPGWLFLTGSEKDVQIVTKKLGLGTLQATAPRDNHSTTLMVGHEPSGQWMKNSVTDNPRFVAGSVQTFLGWPDLLQSKNYAQAGPLQLTNGQFLFQNGCMACHSIGGGDKIGPDLLGVTERRQRDWLEKFVLVPDEMLAAGDPVANELLKKYKGVRMPNLGLSREDVADILAHIETRTGEVRDRQTLADAAQPALAGEPGRHPVSTPAANQQTTRE
ncbi:SCO family protein [Polaromonas sp. DSR2-3-2]|uniref:SCO family protein n=1 Tax=unclassified Polaromonas TaxID=2638319 RepID=UPI003CF7CDF3